MDKDKIRDCLTGPVMSLKIPFNQNGLVDYEGIKTIIDRSLDGGSRTIMLTAGDSHFFCLSEDEIAEITRFTCNHTAGRGMVIAADRHHSTDRAIRFAEFAREAGADMVMCLPPDWGSSCTSVSLARHYASVAKIIPVMIVTGCFLPRGKDFALETIERSRELSDNIIAIKDDMGGVFAQELCIQFHDRCAIIAGGQKRNHMNMWPYGCDGYLSTFITFNPAVARKYWRAIAAKDMFSARKVIAGQSIPFFNYISRLPGGFNSAIHGMLEIYGLAQRYRRAPYHTITAAELEKLKAFLKEHALL